MAVAEAGNDAAPLVEESLRMLSVNSGKPVPAASLYAPHFGTSLLSTPPCAASRTALCS